MSRVINPNSQNFNHQSFNNNQSPYNQNQFEQQNFEPQYSLDEEHQHHDSRSFEMSDLGESKRDEELRSNLQRADQQVKAQLNEAERWQQQRIHAEQDRNNYYKREIGQMQKEINDLNSPEANHQAAGEENGWSGSEKQFSTTDRNQQAYQNALNQMYEQETNAYPRDYQFDLNKNNNDLAQRIQNDKYESQHLENLYSQANQARQQILDQNSENQNHPHQPQQYSVVYRYNPENEALKKEITKFRQINEHERLVEAELQEKRGFLNDDVSRRQFQQNLRVNHENEYLDKLLKNKKYVANNFNSDEVALNMRKEQQLDDLVKQAKQKVQSSLIDPNQGKHAEPLRQFQKLTQKQVRNVESQTGKQTILIRGPRDEQDLRVFGVRRQCNECIFLLNKGLSSHYCQDCGNFKPKKHPNHQIPKRFSGIL